MNPITFEELYMNPFLLLLAIFVAGVGLVFIWNTGCNIAHKVRLNFAIRGITKKFEKSHREDNKDLLNKLGM
jgi:hypothetical protein